MEAQTAYMHGISESGNLNVRKTIKVIVETEGKQRVFESSSKDYSPANINEMEGFDDLSKDIAEAIKDISPTVKTINEVGLDNTITYDCKTEGKFNVNARKILRIYEDGIEIGKKYIDQQVFYPGRNAKGYPAIIKAAIDAIHTPEVIAAYQATVAKLG